MIMIIFSSKENNFTKYEKEILIDDLPERKPFFFQAQFCNYNQKQKVQNNDER